MSCSVRRIAPCMPRRTLRKGNYGCRHDATRDLIYTLTELRQQPRWSIPPESFRPIARNGLRACESQGTGRELEWNCGRTHLKRGQGSRTLRPSPAITSWPPVWHSTPILDVIQERYLTECRTWLYLPRQLIHRTCPRSGKTARSSNLALRVVGFAV